MENSASRELERASKAAAERGDMAEAQRLMDAAVWMDRICELAESGPPLVKIDILAHLLRNAVIFLDAMDDDMEYTDEQLERILGVGRDMAAGAVARVKL